MDPINILSEIFATHIEEVSATAVSAAEVISEASEVMVHALLSDHKILCTGSGSQNCAAQLFTSHLINQFSRERPGLPAITLSADANLVNTLAENHQYADGVARQINTLGNRGDILLLLAGQSMNYVTRSISAAHEREMTIVLIHGGAQHDAAALLNMHDIDIALPVSQGARQLEVNILLINSLCELIDLYLFGGTA